MRNRYLAVRLLITSLLATFGTQLMVVSCLGQASQSSTKLNVIDSRGAWESMPKERNLSGADLPSWARSMAPTLPYTTAAMLELDYLLRTAEKPNARNRGIVRVAISTENRSPFGLRLAEYDMRAAGVDSDWVAKLLKSPKDLSGEDKQLFEFARKMTVSASQVTDQELQQLHDKFGEEELVGIVLQISYGNMQDRLIHALGLQDFDQVVLPPLNVAFEGSTPTGKETKSANRAEFSADSEGKGIETEMKWSDLTIENLRERLSFQQKRKARIRIPDWDEIQAKLPPGLYPKPLGIRWSRLVVGHQPVVGPAWIKCLRVFEMEAHQDRVFEESVFWVVTRSLKCFYCMGHCEMLMEVGGLNRQQISARTEQLSKEDWNEFNAKERVAFGFAKKLSYAPWSVSEGDVSEIVKTLGEERAIDLVWWVSRCHFMTKVSDAFQLNLETENVFAD